LRSSAEIRLAIGTTPMPQQSDSTTNASPAQVKIKKRPVSGTLPTGRETILSQIVVG
jgi:hypothetical protein